MKPSANNAFLKRFGSRLRALRQEHQASQAELAKEIGVQSRTILMYEQGKMTPSIEVVARLARFFETTTDDLVFNDQEKVKGLRDRELIDCLLQADQLPRRERTLIKDLVELLLTKHNDEEKAATA